MTPAAQGAPASQAAQGALAWTPNELVKRCLMSTEGKSGRVRLELSPGEADGSVVDLVYDGDRGELRVEVEVDEGANDSTLRRWRALGKRLLDRGLPLTAFDLR